MRYVPLLLLLCAPAWAQPGFQQPGGGPRDYNQSVPDAGPAVPPPGQGSADWTQLVAGQWRLSDGRACSRGFGTLAVGNGVIRFEWHLPNGQVNVALERIDGVAGNTVQTTVVSDVNTPNPQVGHRLRYSFAPDSWTSLNLRTGERGRHIRC